jgi:hypothetical protein
MILWKLLLNKGKVALRFFNVVELCPSFVVAASVKENVHFYFDL